MPSTLPVTVSGLDSLLLKMNRTRWKPRGSHSVDQSIPLPDRLRNRVARPLHQFEMTEVYINAELRVVRLLPALSKREKRTPQRPRASSSGISCLTANDAAPIHPYAGLYSAGIRPGFFHHLRLGT